VEQSTRRFLCQRATVPSSCSPRALPASPQRVPAQLSPQDLACIDGHPDFELYQFGHTGDLRVLL